MCIYTYNTHTPKERERERAVSCCPYEILLDPKNTARYDRALRRADRESRMSSRLVVLIGIVPDAKRPLDHGASDGKSAERRQRLTPQRPDP